MIRNFNYNTDYPSKTMPCSKKQRKRKNAPRL
jgi:hypothetical protein